MDINNEYDLICSLGANCSASSNLSQRNLRNTALPFDWTWYNSEETIKALTEGFECNFTNFMQKEKLRKLIGDEYSKSHTDRWQYQDMNTKIFYYNHFDRVMDEDKEIDRVRKIFRKRCEKFDFFLKNSNRVLLIISVICDIAVQPVSDLLNTIQKKYPNCKIEIILQAFNCERNEDYKIGNLQIYKHIRKENIYDYMRTNYEWSFLDDKKLSQLFFINHKKWHAQNGSREESVKNRKFIKKISRRMTALGYSLLIFISLLPGINFYLKKNRSLYLRCLNLRLAEKI